MRRRAGAVGVAAALALGGAGLVMAQDPSAPPAAAPPDAPASAASAASAAPTVPPGAAVNVTGDASLAASAPPDEAAPPPEGPPQEAQVSPAPAPPAAPPQPLARPRFTTAVLQATDKVTAETLRFEARVGERVRYKGMVITPRACEASAPGEAPDSWSYLEITSEPPATPGRPAPAPHEVFHGWMSAGSPSLDPLQSPGYDVWLIACRTAEPAAPSGHA